MKATQNTESVSLVRLGKEERSILLPTRALGGSKSVPFAETIKSNYVSRKTIFTPDSWVNSSERTKTFGKMKFVTVTFFLVLIICDSFQSDFCKQEENVLKCTKLSEIFAVNSYKHVEVNNVWCKDCHQLSLYFELL